MVAGKGVATPTFDRCRRAARYASQVGTLTLLALATTAPGIAAQTEEARLFLSVVDVEGNPVTTLRPGQVTVVEDGQRRVSKALELLDAPLRVSLLLDNGNATHLLLPDLRRGAVAFLGALPEAAEVEVVAFGGQARTVARRTKDRAALAAAVDRLDPDRGSAKYLDALTETLERYERMDADGPFWPVLVVVASNGAEGSASRTRDQTLARINHGFFDLAATVHTVFLRVAALNRQDFLQQEVSDLLATNTGGRLDEVSLGPDLVDRLTALAAEIAARHRVQSRQYLLTYERPRGAEPAQTRIESTGLSGTMIRASADGRLR